MARQTRSHSSRKKPPARAQTNAPYCERAEQYAREVCSGERLACAEVRQACQRHLDDLARIDRGGFRWDFSREKGERFCRFAEAFPHIKDDFLGHASRGERIRLEAWEVFIGVCIFGWVDRELGFRRFTEAFIEVARKNGKTTLAALVALYCLTADGEFGAEVFAGAASKEQAGEVFRAAKAMAEATPQFREAFGVWVNTASLVCQQRAASFKMLKGQPADGPSPHCVLADEYHEYKTDRLLEWARTGMQARRQPLLLEITTAGSDTGSPCYNKHLEAQEVLAGRRVNERLFAIIFTVDKGVDWKTEKAIRMSNPNYGVSVNPEIIAADQFQATQSATQQNAFKTKNLNIWVNQKVAWMNMVKWDACADSALTIDKFLRDECIEGVDLASRRDTVTTVRIFRRTVDREEHFYCFSRHYLNEQQIRDPKNTHFLEWAAKEFLIETPGDITDYLRVNDDLAADAGRLILRELVFDPFHAAPLVQFLQQRPDWNRGVDLVELRQSQENMSAAMKEFEAIVLSGRFHFDGNPLLTWMIGNTVCRVSGFEHWYPIRENAERKIDGTIAIILAINRWMNRRQQFTRPWVGAA